MRRQPTDRPFGSTLRLSPSNRSAPSDADVYNSPGSIEDHQSGQGRVIDRGWWTTLTHPKTRSRLAKTPQSVTCITIGGDAAGSAEKCGRICETEKSLAVVGPTSRKGYEQMSTRRTAWMGARIPVLILVALIGSGAMLWGGAVVAQTSTSVPPASSAPVPPTSSGPSIPGNPSATTTGSSTSNPSTSNPSTPSSSTVAGSPTGAATTVPVHPGTDPSPTTPPLFLSGRVLKQGMKGADVLAMERKLDLLKYFPGKVDGKFDSQTWQAVIAFQKFNGLKRNAQFDVATQERLFGATVPGGVIPNGGLPRVEVDINRQVALIFDEYGLSRVVAVSSGSNRSYCDNAKPRDGETDFKPYKVCGDARTPRGNFKVQRRIKGTRQSSLGTLVNPLYFNGGYAIHGSPSVPGYPASHGCVRVTNVTSNWMFDNVADDTPVYVFD